MQRREGRLGEAMRPTLSALLSAVLVLFSFGVAPSYGLEDEGEYKAPAEQPAQGEAEPPVGQPGNGEVRPPTEQPEEGGEEAEQPPATLAAIEGVSIWWRNPQTGTIGQLASSYGTSNSASIDTRGGSLVLLSQTHYTDGKDEWNTSFVTWASSDLEVASVSRDGTVLATGDGTTTITALIEGENTASGQPVRADLTVNVTGQQDSRYVKSIRILGPDGQRADTPFLLTADGDLNQNPLTCQFYAEVTGVDPATEEQPVYSTQNGKLSSQAPDLTDISWAVDDESFGYVDAASGMFRALITGNAVLRATSNSGLGGAAVSGSIWVAVSDPNANPDSNEYLPQDHLRVVAYYELYPPTNPHDLNDPNFVINHVFSVDEVKALGATRATYTTLNAQNYWTVSAEGVPVSTVLAAAGVNMEGIAGFEFGTEDSFSRYISFNYMFETPHYYLPNANVPDAVMAGAQQVYPMLAYSERVVKNGRTEPNFTDMSDGTRFHLLCGTTGRNDYASDYMIKWINTIYVCLEGGPAVNPNPGDGPGSGSGSEGTGSGAGDGQGAGGGQGSGAGTGTGAGSDSGSADEGDDPNAAGAPNGDENASGTSSRGGATALATKGPGGANGAESSEVAEEQSSLPEDGTPLAGSGSGGEGANGASGTQGGFAIYQVMNNHDSAVATPIPYENPYHIWALPLGLVALVLGSLWELMFYRRQTKEVAMAAPG